MAATAAAARLLQRRLTSLLRQDHSSSPLSQGFTRRAWKPAAFRTLHSQAAFRTLHSQAGSVNGADHNSTDTEGADGSSENTKICGDGPHIPTKFPEMAKSHADEFPEMAKSRADEFPEMAKSRADEFPEMAKSHADEFDLKYKALSNLKTSGRHNLVMIFTCKVCETRSMKTICRESYEKGVVMVRCGGCDNLHLIADRLGWFGNPASVEDFLAARGERVTKGSVDTINLTLNDVAESSEAMN